ncbi:DUF4209 domain-containing protein [Yinghuangia sp. ASG 101]|uniref:DUF4209 domain-containing protein n=1 Tax=Yinghuangia sp. ASG 101 TaxID=2896848 RepID=UPI001E5BBF73|nr:DUF4209 domain-containing protein [Yinghuangia sp. ASG 101]UGQ15126.1 DUF4209 domain-containing protein [Yinghuangia sp. ASG 101]
MTYSDADLSLAIASIDSAVAGKPKFEAQRAVWEIFPIVFDSDTSDLEDKNSSLGTAISWAFAYKISVGEVNGKPRCSVEAHYTAASGEITPPPPRSVADEIKRIWATVATESGTSFVRARAYHLLFEAKIRPVVDNARRACENYIDTALGWEIGLDRTRYLNIALRLARAISARDLVAHVTGLMVQDIGHCVENPGYGPGISLPLINALNAERPSPKMLDALLEQAYARYEDPFIRDEIVQLQIQRADADDVRRLHQEKLVSVWRNAAEGADGIVRASHLQTALERAEQTQQRDLIQRAASELQSIRNEDLELQTFRASIQRDPSEIDRLLRPITTASDWSEALGLFCLAYGPATGDVNANRATATRNQQEFVFLSLLDTQLLGGDGLPSFAPQSDDDRAEMRLAQQETHNLQATGPFLALALSTLARTHGIPSEDSMTEFFAQHALVDEDLAGAIARSFTRFWVGDFEAAGFTAAPRIETLARNLLISSNVGIYRLQRNEKPGQYPGLGFLLGALLETGLDESWYRCLYTVCANPAGGWNVRNEISHGFVDNVPSAVAAVLLQALMYLWLLAPADDEENYGSSDDTTK